MAGQSLLERLNLPDGFGYALLMLGLILTLAPWLRGSDFGMFKIPEFAPGTRRGLVYAGPLTLMLAIGLHLPMAAPAPPPPVPDPPGSATGRTTTVRPAGGQRVLADWQDSGCLYPARLVAAEGGTATLLFDFDERATVPVSEVFVPGEARLEIGRAAYARLPNREAWLPVTIIDTRTENVRVERAEQAGCSAEFGKAVRWVPASTLIAAIPVGEAR